MPSKYAVKKYEESGIYHVFNRGVNKNRIFLDEEDYLDFISIAKHYLTPSKKNYLNTKNFANSVKLLGFCLIPNHLHMLLQQIEKTDMEDFMRCLMTSYVGRVNKKHDRVGPLFQGVYQARLITDDADLVNVSYYIHNNPKSELKQNPLAFPYSSIHNYTNSKEKKFEFVDENIILGMFNSPEEYIEGLKNYKPYDEY